MTSRDDEERTVEASIREAALAMIDEGRLPDASELNRHFPGHGDTVDLVLGAVARLHSVTEELGAARRQMPVIEPGTRLGDFTVLDLAGEGGMGRIYRARQRSLGDRIVALKVVAVPDDSNSTARRGDGRPDAMTRFRQEAIAASQLHHPHLAEIHGFGEENGVVFYAMRFVEGPTLAESLHRLAHSPGECGRPETRRRVVERVAEIASALAVVHEAGLVHGDVKPGNIILEGGRDSPEALPEFPAVLVDFGLARAATPEGSPAMSAVSATPRYAAPEVLRRGHTDARSDVFSLGATLHDLLAGREARDRFEAAIGLEPLTDLVPGINVDLAAVVAKAVDPKPEHRYRDAADLLADLAAVLKGDEVTARKPRLIESSRRLITRRPLASAVLGGVILLLVLAFTSVARQLVDVGSLTDQADAALGSGDAVALGARLQDLRNASFAAWVMPERLEGLAASFWSSESDVLARLYYNLRAGRFLEASHGVAEHLIDHRADADPFYFAYLAHELQLPVVERRAAASLAASRLFMHEPDLSPEAAAQSAACRMVLMKLLEDQATPAGVRLDALAALSGCGTPDLVTRLVGLAGRTSTSTEERRLTANTIGATLFRAGKCGFLESGLPPMDFIKAATRLIKADRRRAAETGHMGMQAIDWHPLFLGGVSYLRDAGVGFEGVDRVADLVQAAVDEWTWHEIRALWRDPTLQEELPSVPTELTPSSVAYWASACRSFDDKDLISRVRQTCSKLDSMGLGFDVLASFEDGYRIRDQLLSTRRIAQLGETSRSASSEESSPQSLPSTPMPAATGQDVVAEWDFAARTVGLVGAATGVMGRNSRHTQEQFGISAEQTHWRLIPGGPAEMSLEVNLPPTDMDRPLELVLTHLAAGRNSVPNRGTSFVGVSLDDDVLHSRATVYSSAWRRDRFELPVVGLGEGPHVVTIQLQPWSTTTYWVRHAALVRR